MAGDGDVMRSSRGWILSGSAAAKLLYHLRKRWPEQKQEIISG